MVEKRSPLDIYAALLIGATLIAVASLAFVFVRAWQLTGDNPFSLLTHSK